ncbi:MAG: hypothetical protein AAF242_15520, partial [Bacteroidota bacterium]
TNESMTRQKGNEVQLLIPEFTELWNDNPKLIQVIDDIINWSDLEGLRQKIIQFQDKNVQTPDEGTFMPQLKLLDILDPRKQTHTNLSLHNFILHGDDQVILQAVLDSGDHWLNEYEVGFVLKSWERRVDEILKKRDLIPSPVSFLGADLMNDNIAQNSIKPSWNALARIDDKMVSGEEELLTLRALYQKLQLVLDYPRLRTLLPFPIFLSGPHQETLDFAAQQFGHYNPSFVDWLSKHAIPKKDSSPFWQIAKGVYTRFFQDQTRLHYAALQQIKENKALKEKTQAGYQALLATGQSTAGYFAKELFQMFTVLPEYVKPILAKSSKFQYGYAIGFWIRRSIDGSFDSFEALLEAVLASFDEEILQH